MGGCLTRMILLLGLCALLLVGACVLGFVKNDPATGKPELSLDGIKELDSLNLPPLALPDVGTLMEKVSLPETVALPGWAYGVNGEGLTIKTLRAGEGEAVLICADGYTMLAGGGSGMGIALTGQLSFACSAASFVSSSSGLPTACA